MNSSSMSVNQQQLGGNSGLSNRSSDQQSSRGFGGMQASGPSFHANNLYQQHQQQQQFQHQQLNANHGNLMMGNVVGQQMHANPMDGLSVFLNQQQQSSHHHQMGVGAGGFGGFASKLNELQVAAAYNPYTSLASMISGLSAGAGVGQQQSLINVSFFLIL
jgi:hypothetical protein